MTKESPILSVKQNLAVDAEKSSHATVRISASAVKPKMQSFRGAQNSTESDDI
jgi:hypothetical protein